MSVSVRQRVYDHVRHKLMTGQLRPGTRLSNRVLAKEIDASTIPVREALTQLTTEGLLEHKPGVGIFVIELSTQELADLCDVREALECHAVRSAVARVSDAEVDALRECLQAMREVVERVEAEGEPFCRPWHVEPWTLADVRFHVAILRAAGNRRALKIVSDLRVMTFVFAYRDDRRTPEQLRRAMEEHQRIFEAIEQRDADRAVRVMAEHLARKTDSILRIYDRSRMEREAETLPSITFPDALRAQIHQLEEPSGDGKQHYVHSHDSE